MDLIRSALHVLRCILRHDSFCRDKVLARLVHTFLTVSCDAWFGKRGCTFVYFFDLFPNVHLTSDDDLDITSYILPI